MTAFLVALWVRSMLLAGIGTATLRLLRRRSASVRHAVAMGALLAILALPLLGIALPGRTDRILPSSVVIHTAGLFEAPATAVPGALHPAPASTQVAAKEKMFDGLPLLWALGTAALGIRLAWHLAVMARRIRTSVPAEGSDALRIAPDCRVPMTAWWGRSYVLVPPAWSEWTEELREDVLRHEHAHIRRGDWSMRIACRIVAALFWPNPLAWRLIHHAQELSEQATDDLVLASGIAPSRYSAHLLTIAREVTKGTSVCAVPMTETGELSRRIEMILDTKLARRALTARGALAVGTGLFAVSVPLAAWALGPVAPVLQAGKKAPSAYVIQVKLMKTMQPKIKGVTVLSGPHGGKYPVYDYSGMRPTELIAHPTVVTTENSPATIELDDPRRGNIKFTFTPSKDSKGVISTKVKYEVSKLDKGGKAEVRRGAFTYREGEKKSPNSFTFQTEPQSVYLVAIKVFETPATDLAKGPKQE